MQEVVYSPSDFIAVLNQTLEYAYPIVVIEGELSNFKVAKNRWVYFDLMDQDASVRFFGTIYSLPGPLEDGMRVRVIGSPRMHPRFGFSVNFQSILPVGEGTLKKAADLLFKKLTAEGLFEIERKRLLPRMPQNIGLITAADSAAAADFTKILNERWGGVDVLLADVYVQGDQAPMQIVQAIEHFNQLSTVPEVLVITRGGGSTEDLAAFSDERVVRAVAASRIPTLVAIGHEVDVCLAELAADQRASTSSNAVQLLVPDKKHELVMIKNTKSGLLQTLDAIQKSQQQDLANKRSNLNLRIENIIAKKINEINTKSRLVNLYDPNAALKRGYAIVMNKGKFIKSVGQVKIADRLSLKLTDGTISTEVISVENNG